MDPNAPQVLVNGMRVRIKLDERRLAELLKDVDAANVAGLLSHLGDVAALSFAPFMNGGSSGRQCHRLPLVRINLVMQNINFPCWWT